MRCSLASSTAALALVLSAGVAAAHITPPVVLVSDRDAVVGLLSGARRFFVREYKPSAADRQAVARQTGWTPEEDFYRFYLGRDTSGGLVAATIFVSEYTVHGPVRVAVALNPDGKVRGATVIEVSEETYHWVKPLIDQNLAQTFVGQDSHGKFAVTRTGLEAMPQFYAQVIASLVQRGAVLYELGVLKAGGA
jgi:hypothetical protein